jgi:uncharacterized OsmC-like protein
MITVKHIGDFRMEITPDPALAKTYTDVYKKYGGLEIYPSPGGMLAEALAACALSTACLSAHKHGTDTSNFYAQVEGIEMDEASNSIARITIHLHVSKDIAEDKRPRLEAATKRGCVVGNSIKAEEVLIFSYDV